MMLAVHFQKGGTVQNVKGDLARVSIPDRESCYHFHLRRKKLEDAGGGEGTCGLHAHTFIIDDPLKPKHKP